jgi:hypothetical protein
MNRLYWLSSLLVGIIVISLFVGRKEHFDQNLQYVANVTSHQNIKKNITGTFDKSCSSCGLSVDGENFALSCKCKDTTGKLINSNIRFPVIDKNPNISNCNGKLVKGTCPIPSKSCYGARPQEDCDTCDKVIAAYNAKKWAYDKNNFDQCKA